MLAFFRHLFTPHKTNNQRAKILHVESILAIAVMLFAGSFFLSPLKASHPEVLGSAVDISTKDLLALTNVERQKLHLAPLSYNNELAVAAAEKASDMFAHNYWAHISPSGTTPWYFITKSGYVYTYAGENLARGFSTASDTVNAWMASPTHRANIVSPNYQDVGFSVEEGTLTGEANTILVVEMFGGRQSQKVEGQNTQLPSITKNAFAESSKQVSSGITTTPLIDRFAFAKNTTQFLLLFFIGIFILDIILIERKKISRIVGHNLDHILFLIGILIFIAMIGSGVIF